MGSFLGLVFVAGAAVLGVYVGTRPTVIDGRRISAEMEKAVAEKGIAVECDREIRIGVGGAAFSCVLSRGADRERVEFSMTRDGAYAPAGRPAAGAAPGARGED